MILDGFYSPTPCQERWALCVRKTDEVASVKLNHRHRPSRVGAVYWLKIEQRSAGSQFAFVSLPNIEAGHQALPLGLLNLNAISASQQKLFTEGSYVLAQLHCESVAQKGPQLSPVICLNGRYGDYYPFNPVLASRPMVGIQTKPESLIKVIGKSPPLAALAKLLTDDRGEDEAKAVDQYRLHLRSLGVSPDIVRQEMLRLQQLWQSSLLSIAKAESAKSNKPQRIIAAESLLEQSLRTLASDADFTSDDRLAIRQAALWRDQRWPDLHRNFELYTPSSPSQSDLWQAQGFDSLAEDLANPYQKLWLAGNRQVNLWIESTHALWAVDVDVPPSLMQKNPSQLAELNRQIAVALAQRIKLLDLSGLIVIDLPKYKNYQLARPMLEAFRHGLREEARQVAVLGLSAAGLVEIQRQKFGPSLPSMLRGDEAETIAWLHQIYRLPLDPRESLDSLLRQTSLGTAAKALLYPRGSLAYVWREILARNGRRDHAYDHVGD